MKGQAKRLRWSLKLAAVLLLVNAWATATGLVPSLYAML